MKDPKYYEYLSQAKQEAKSRYDANLTEKESTQLRAFIDGMDMEKEGWLHEMAIFEGKTLSGVVSSLIKKGLITSQEYGNSGDFWIVAK